MAETEKDPIKYFKSEIKRLNYYNSQFLVDTDFNDEQLYHRQMRRMHNRALHTWGIAEGLQVERVPNESKVTVAPGIAIDRLGQEIVLPERSAAISFDTFDAGAQVYVTIKYADVTDPADKDVSDTQAKSERFKRMRERPVVSASAIEPTADVPDVLLAVVKLDNNKAIENENAIPSKRRYTGSRIGSSGNGKEFSIYADASDAWHFYDGGKGSDRLTIDDKGNVGIGTSTPASALSISGAGNRVTKGPKTWNQSDQFIFDSYADADSGHNRLFDIAAIGNTNGAAGGSSIRLITNPVNSNTGVERLRVDYNGNVGIGTPPTSARLSVHTTPGPYEGALMDFVVAQYRLSIRSKSPASDTVAYHFDLVNNLGRFDSFLVLDRGNVGIGTPIPEARLDVRGHLILDPGANPTLYTGTGSAELNRYLQLINSPGLNNASGLKAGGLLVADDYNFANPAKNDMVVKGRTGIGTPGDAAYRLDVAGLIRSTAGGFVFPDGTTQLTAAGSARIPAQNVTAGSFGANTGGGNYTFPAALYWGNGAARTETKDDAGAKGSKSGFFETAAPVNYYQGANSWQHLIEARHSNNANNFALQIAGGFFDQNLYMRKTADNGATKWSQFVLMNPDGNVGIGSVGAGAGGVRLSVDTGGGTAVSLKCEHRGSNFIVRPLSNGSNSAVIENTGGGALFINPGGGNVGIGTTDAGAKLDVAGDVKITGKLIIGDWSLESRVDGAWNSPRSALFISFQGMVVARFGTFQDMLQIWRFSNSTGRQSGRYFYVNVDGPGNT